MDADKIKQAYQALEDDVLTAGHSYYFPIYDHPELAPCDPLDELLDNIEMSRKETLQLFSGFRGTGKSTELRRLKQRIEAVEDASYKVVICEMSNYLNFTSPVDVSDFLLAITGAFSDVMEEEAYLGVDPARESYWTRFWHYLKTTEIELSSIGLTAGAVVDGIKAGATIKANLREDPSFLRQLQEHMKGRLGTLRSHVHAFFADCLKALRARHGKNTQLVLIFDSIEHYRGTSINADDVADSVEMLFRGHANALRIPFIHTVYTVPPWLRLRSPGISESCDCYQQLPCVKVRTQDGETHGPGLDALRKLVALRFEWDLLLGGTAQFDELALHSGGYLRDLFRLLQQGLRFARRRETPLDEATITLMIDELRNAYKDSFTNDEAQWLARIDQCGQPDADSRDEYVRLAHFFDTHFVLAYRNGTGWYGLHPIIRTMVLERAQAYQARQEFE